MMLIDVQLTMWLQEESDLCNVPELRIYSTVNDERTMKGSLALTCTCMVLTFK